MSTILTSNDILIQMTHAQFGDDGTQGSLTSEPGGTSGEAQDQVATGPFGTGFMPMLMVLLVGMIVFSMLGGRKQKKKRAAMLDSLQKRDSVVTQGGVFGTIVEIKPDRVVLKVDESSNTRITVLRESITQVTAETSAE